MGGDGGGVEGIGEAAAAGVGAVAAVAAREGASKQRMWVGDEMREVQE